MEGKGGRSEREGDICICIHTHTHTHRELIWASLMTQTVKNLPEMQET